METYRLYLIGKRRKDYFSKNTSKLTRYIVSSGIQTFKTDVKEELKVYMDLAGMKLGRIIDRPENEANITAFGTYRGYELVEKEKEKEKE